MEALEYYIRALEEERVTSYPSQVLMENVALEGNTKYVNSMNLNLN